MAEGVEKDGVEKNSLTELAETLENLQDIKLTRRAFLKNAAKGAALSVLPTLPTNTRVKSSQPEVTQPKILERAEAPKPGDIIAWQKDNKTLFGTVSEIRPGKIQVITSEPTYLSGITVTDLPNRSQLLEAVGPENLPVKKLNEILTHFHIDLAPKGTKMGKDYGRALTARWLVNLNAFGIPLKSLPLAEEDQVFINIDPEGVNGFWPADEDNPTDRISINSVQNGLIHETTHWLLRRGVGAAGLNEGLAEIQNARMTGENLTEPEKSSFVCTTTPHTEMTYEDVKESAFKLAELDKKELPGVVNYIFQKTLENQRVKKEHIPMPDVEGWVGEKYGTEGLKVFLTQSAFYCS